MHFKQSKANEMILLQVIQIFQILFFQGSLGRDLANAETKLSQAENDKKVKDDQIGQLREEIAHQEELISKLNREKKNIGESKLKEEEQVWISLFTYSMVERLI